LCGRWCPSPRFRRCSRARCNHNVHIWSCEV